jgi:tripartite-type tricarboxylate transporter receptor subunit TctC
MGKNMDNFTLLTIAVGILLALFLSVPAADSADFPKKPIKIIVTSSAGGGEDMEARGVAPFLEKYLGVRVIIEDQPGAGGRIAFEKFQKATPDGYSLITSSFPKSIILEYMTKTGYRTKDFTPVFVWSRMDSYLTVNAETWKTFDEFMKVAKSRTLSVGIPGRGGTNHLSGLMMIDKLGINVKWIPYEAGANAYAALAGKHIDVAMGSNTGLTGLLDAGKVRSLMICSSKRNPYLPDVPTPRELGIDIDPVVVSRGVAAPPNTSPAIVNMLEQAFRKVSKDPGFIDWARKNKVVLTPMSAKEFRKIVENTYPMVEKFQGLLKEG